MYKSRFQGYSALFDIYSLSGLKVITGILLALNEDK